MQSKRKINLIAIFILLLCNNCHETNRYSNIQAVTDDNDLIKTTPSAVNTQNQGEQFGISKSGDTVQVYQYIDRSLAYRIDYDSMGKKTADYRKIYFTLDKTPTIKDSVTFSFFIHGPSQDKMFLSAAAVQVKPDSNIRFQKHLIYDTINKIDKYTFIPKNKGTYWIRFSCFDEELLKMVGHAETYLIIE